MRKISGGIGKGRKIEKKLVEEWERGEKLRKISGGMGKGRKIEKN